MTGYYYWAKSRSISFGFEVVSRILYQEDDYVTELRPRTPGLRSTSLMGPTAMNYSCYCCFKVQKMRNAHNYMGRWVFGFLRLA